MKPATENPAKQQPLTKNKILMKQKAQTQRKFKLGPSK